MVRANQTVINCSFKHNTAVSGGAAHIQHNASVTFIGTRVEHNAASASPKGGGGTGGGIRATDRAEVCGGKATHVAQ